MKKTIALLCLAAGLLSCAKESTPQEEPAAGVPVKFEISVAETKSVAKSDWETGDLIYVFIMGIPDKYVKMTRESDGSWKEETVGEEFTLIEFGALDDHYQLTAVHFPVSVDVAYVDDGDFDKNRFTFTSGGKPVFGTYYLSDQTTYTLSSTTVTASLQMEIPDGMVQLYFPGGEGRPSLADYTLASPMIQPVSCASVSVNGTLQEDVLQAGARMGGGMPYDAGVIFAGRYTTPAGAGGHWFSLANDTEIWSYTRDSEAAPLVGGTLYTFPNFPGSGWSIETASNLYVDLGLSVKWAKWNLGATKPEEYGDYFAWGEIAPKTNFSWGTYKWIQEGQSSSEYITKYTFADDLKAGIWYDGDTFIGDSKTCLQDYANADDAAYAALGGKFRIPTDEEWTKLIECTWTWTNNYNGTGIAGRIVTGTNGNTIFLPAAGYYFGTSLYSKGSRCNYWSSSLGVSSDYARSEYFDSDHVLRFSGDRFSGHSIRPVCD